MTSRVRWTKTEDSLLLASIDLYGVHGSWDKKAAFVGNNKTAASCYQHYHRCLSANISREKLSNAEIYMLCALVHTMGPRRWAAYAKGVSTMGHGTRTGTQLRSRWLRLLQADTPIYKECREMMQQALSSQVHDDMIVDMMVAKGLFTRTQFEEVVAAVQVALREGEDDTNGSRRSSTSTVMSSASLYSSSCSLGTLGNLTLEELELDWVPQSVAQEQEFELRPTHEHQVRFAPLIVNEPQNEQGELAALVLHGSSSSTNLANSSQENASNHEIEIDWAALTAGSFVPAKTMLPNLVVACGPSGPASKRLPVRSRSLPSYAFNLGQVLMPEPASAISIPGLVLTLGDGGAATAGDWALPPGAFS